MFLRMGVVARGGIEPSLVCLILASGNAYSLDGFK